MESNMSDTQLLKNVAEQNQRIVEKAQLNRFQWLQCALNIFVSEGINSVRVTRIADELNVSRGSFYWHFDNREDLVSDLVKFWKEKNTNGIIQSVNQPESLHQGIFKFFETTINEALFDSRLDLAVREWARRSEKVRKLLDFEDQTRITAIRNFFELFGYHSTDALIRARVLYFSQIGFYALSVKEPLKVRVNYTEHYYECFTGKKAPKKAIKDFQNHILTIYGEP